MDIEVLIEKFGGLRPMARKLNVEPPIISYWRRTGKIPAWRETDIRAALDRHMIDLDDETA